MVNNNGSFQVREPGEQLTPGTTFAEGFGFIFTDESSSNYQERLNRIDENERQAALLGRTMVIGSAEVGRVVSNPIDIDNPKQERSFPFGPKFRYLSPHLVRFHKLK